MGLAWAALALACAGCATTGSVSGRVVAPGKNSDEAVVTADPTDTSKKKQHTELAQAVLTFTDGQFFPSVLLVDRAPSSASRTATASSTTRSA
jgi:hypothetical protein